MELTSRVGRGLWQVGSPAAGGSVWDWEVSVEETTV